MIVRFECNGLTRKFRKLVGAVVAVRQDIGVDAIRFVLNQNQFNSLTLAGCDAEIAYKDTDGTTKTAASSVQTIDNELVVDWAFNADVADESGMISFSLTLSKSEGGTVTQEWHSLPGEFKVHDTVEDPGEAEG